MEVIGAYDEEFECLNDIGTYFEIFTTIEYDLYVYNSQKNVINFTKAEEDKLHFNFKQANNHLVYQKYDKLHTTYLLHG